MNTNSATNEVIAYLAGFFDGEGCVYINKGRRGNGYQYGLEISYTNSEIEPLELARSALGGQISALKEVRAGRKQVYRLRLRSNQAASALKMLLPYLRTKKERAEIAIEFQSKFQGTGRVRSLSLEECEEYRQAIRLRNDKVWNQQSVEI